MSGSREKRLKIACCGLCCIALASTAAAAPPVPNTPNNSFLERASGLLAARARAATQHLEFGKLDLRAPDEVPTPRPAEAESAFPSARHTEAAAQPRTQDDLPGLANGPSLHTVSRAQAMAERFQREGLPVARLWQNHAAMVSIGLNQRGKPGLWLIQKIP